MSIKMFCKRQDVTLYFISISAIAYMYSTYTSRSVANCHLWHWSMDHGQKVQWEISRHFKDSDTESLWKFHTHGSYSEWGSIQKLYHCVGCLRFKPNALFSLGSWDLCISRCCVVLVAARFQLDVCVFRQNVFCRDVSGSCFRHLFRPNSLTILNRRSLVLPSGQNVTS